MLMVPFWHPVAVLASIICSMWWKSYNGKKPWYFFIDYKQSPYAWGRITSFKWEKQQWTKRLKENHNHPTDILINLGIPAHESNFLEGITGGQRLARLIIDIWCPQCLPQVCICPQHKWTPIRSGTDHTLLNSTTHWANRTHTSCLLRHNHHRPFFSAQSYKQQISILEI